MLDEFDVSVWSRFVVLEPEAFYLIDRGYLDFARLFVIHKAKAFSMPRSKSNIKFKRRY